MSRELSHAYDSLVLSPLLVSALVESRLYTFPAVVGILSWPPRSPRNPEHHVGPLKGHLVMPSALT